MEGRLLNNRYSILKTLGGGGFSQTFLAVNIGLPSKKKCVIKKLKLVTHIQKQQWMRIQFQKEAEALERLGAKSQQIPRLYAYFSEGETFYLVQEWIEGITLKQKQQLQGILPEQEVRKILISLLLVLDYIHSRQIIHQDIKPENVILRARDELPVLIDFGAVIEAIGTWENKQKNPVMVMGTGTPGYMAPEQMSGYPVFASDLYSLGLTAIYLLTGKTPQDLDTNWDTGEIIWHQEADRLSSNLVGVLDKAIRLHLGDRFASAREMLAALKFKPVILYHLPQLLSAKIAHNRLEKTATIAKTPDAENSYFSAKSELVATDNYLPRNNTHKILKLLIILGVGVVIAISSTEPTSLEPTTQDYFLKTFSLEPTFPSVSLNNPYFESLSVPSYISVGSPKNLIYIPIFVTGTKDEQIVKVLGEPTWRRRGYWANSIAWLYQDILPNQIDIGYLFDTTTKRLLQTEISFASSISLEKMQKTLTEMLKGNISTLASEGLKKVYERQIDLQKFQVADLEGLIQRNDKDRIYIGIWETGFHVYK